MNNIDNIRHELIKKRISYIQKLKKKNIDVSLSSLSSFRTLLFNNLSLTSNDVELGNISRKINIVNFIYQIKNFLYILKFADIKIVGNYSRKNLKKYTKMVVAWSDEKDFSDKGEYYNKYFRTSSREKNIFWFLIHLGNKKPKKIKKNIIILYHPKKIFGLNIILLLKYLFKILKEKNFLLNRAYHELSFDSLLAHTIKDFFAKILNFYNPKKIIFPYESQPFQNCLINLVKKNDKKITLIGYDHSSNPFPMYNIYNSNSPDLLYVHSKASKIFYSKYFKWPKNKVKKIPSIKIIKKQLSEYKNKIFLPYDFFNENEIVKNFELFLNLSQVKQFTPMEVKIHPTQYNSKKHLILKKKIQLILKIYKHRFSKDSRESLSIHIGNLSTVIEALEVGITTIHIVCDPVFDLFSSRFWPTIKVKELSSNIYKYSIKEFGNCLTFKNKKSYFHKIH